MFLRLLHFFSNPGHLSESPPGSLALEAQLDAAVSAGVNDVNGAGEPSGDSQQAMGRRWRFLKNELEQITNHLTII
jgi:hypothetical protein